MVRDYRRELMVRCYRRVARRRGAMGITYGQRACASAHAAEADLARWDHSGPLIEDHVTAWADVGCKIWGAKRGVGLQVRKEMWLCEEGACGSMMRRAGCLVVRVAGRMVARVGGNRHGAGSIMG